ncbi:hypothetical protein PVC01_140046500 [Plasmodium vivax]|uniref:(malaria parasite P. vivax) hypothetical protein n=1 Tax=Plasmodium vivax TaxID=5855 RepID=A0A1G4H577_PLAVI|nr:unnamed protein product [Plasmodium vivax]SCO69982.1 hypothetical protein PVT01_140046000 [Plasmodium vivax]SCO75473.1 hypothetical protein PVC01_140046500 [Plasmodium vivax]
MKASRKGEGSTQNRVNRKYGKQKIRSIQNTANRKYGLHKKGLENNVHSSPNGAENQSLQISRSMGRFILKVDGCLGRSVTRGGTTKGAPKGALPKGALPKGALPKGASPKEESLRAGATNKPATLRMKWKPPPATALSAQEMQTPMRMVTM